jgi:hypothetical protein
VWHEAGERAQCEAASEEKLATKLEKVKVRLEADAPGMSQPGSALIAHYLDPDRLPAGRRTVSPTRTIPLLMLPPVSGVSVSVISSDCFSRVLPSLQQPAACKSWCRRSRSDMGLSA